MRAEAEQADKRHRQQRGARAQRHAHALARTRRGEHQERQHQARGELQPDAGGERRGGGARMRARPRRAGGQHERRRQRQQQQRVVVRSALRQHQHHRVQADERRRPNRGVAHAPGRTRDQRDRAEARQDGKRLERPQPAGQPQRHERVAQQREQRAVRRVLERPADERVHRVARRFGGEVRVRVEPVQRAHARERQVAEHVLGDQRRPQQQDHVRDHDRRRDPRERQPARGHQHQRVADADRQQQRLEAGARQADAQTSQRPRHPCRPAAGAGGDELGGTRSGARAHQEDTHDEAHQPEHAERAHEVKRRL